MCRIVRLSLRAVLLLSAVFMAALAVGAPAASAQQTGARGDAAQDRPYAIGPLDRLDIRVFEQDNLSGNYRVGSDGAVSFPLIGRVDADGRTAQELEELLRERLAAGFLRDPRVNVTVTEYRSRRVFVLGEVRRPGVFPLPLPMTVTELLALAEGRTKRASTEAVVLRGGGAGAEETADPKSVRVDLDALGRGDVSQNLTLQAGDTVFVPRAAVVYVFGEVRRPGRYEMRGANTVLQALTLAGGATAFTALERILIVRTVDGELVEIRAALSDPVQPDDVVRVPGQFY